MTRVTLRLRSATIIPPELYVERAADRQLAETIDDLGRPGYVLVARQMGKTNLLINMKRKLESSSDGVIYVDLSTRFSDLRQCLRNIIDIGLDTLRFVGDGPDIIRSMRLSDMSPQSEYERSLRALLTTAAIHRLVVVLDEVDSLTAAKYSDGVFALVRSMYFSRINYPEFERLTYVLSGVADPIDLIKDKTISPFNIGEKIFLNDFTIEEFGAFLKKADLNLTKSVRDRIYHWTRGNPRMTWDVCSTLEEALTSSEPTPTDVDRIVGSLYLERFDIPPVDHIRELVTSDVQLAGAVMDIRAGRAASLSSRLKSRLYLAGITNSADRIPEIKNPVIENALNERWLRALEQDRLDPLTAALAHFGEGRFTQAVVVIEDYMARHRDETLSGPVLAALGQAQYNLGYFWQSTKALEAALELVPDDEKPPLAFILGSAYLNSSQPADSRRHLKTALKGTGDIATRARVLLGTSYLQEDGVKYEKEIIEVTEAAIGAALAQGISNRVVRETLTLAYYNMAVVHVVAKRISVALNYIEQAIKTAPPAHSLEPMLFKVRLLTSPSERVRVLDTAVQHLIEHALEPQGQGPVSLALTELALGELVLLLMRDNRDHQVDRLLKYLSDALQGKPSPFQTLLLLFRALDNAGRGERSLQLLRRAVRQYMDSSSLGRDRIRAYRWLSKYELPEWRQSAYDDYLTEMECSFEPNDVEEDDFNVLMAQVGRLIETRRFDKALRAVKMMAKIAEYFEGHQAIFLLISMYYRMTVYYAQGEIRHAQSVAKAILETGRPGTKKLTAFQLEWLRRINADAAKIAREGAPLYPKDLRRNDRIKVREGATGTIHEVKFKHAEASLRSGAFVFIEIAEPGDGE